MTLCQEQLDKLLSSDPGELITSLHDTYISEWDQLLSNSSSRRHPSTDFEHELVMKIVVILGSKVSLLQAHVEEQQGITVQEGEKLRAKQAKILAVTCSNSKFVEVLKTVVSKASLFPEKHEHLRKMLEGLDRFCNEVIHVVPSLGTDSLHGLVCACIGVTSSVTELRGLQAKFVEILEKIRGINKNEEVAEGDSEPPNDFRGIPIVPSLDELVEHGCDYLRANKVNGPYNSADHYLDVQFRLLREDLVRPLREAVRWYMNKKTAINPTQLNNSVQVSEHITLKCIESTHANEKHYIFNLPNHSTVNWEKSKRLLPGCLVMLTADDCKTGIFAVTLSSKLTKHDIRSARHELANGMLRVRVENGKELIRAKSSYVMFECEAYFEAYKYNLKILQDIMFLENGEERVNRLCKFIVKGSRDVGFPGYFESEEDSPVSWIRLPGKRDEVVVPMWEPMQWDGHLVQAHVGLNTHQYEAYRTALTSELAVIQGPPGTGKTFVGLQIVKTLLLNRRGPSKRAMNVEEYVSEGGAVPNTPIMVLCYTNHALDQFLELLINEIPGLRVARVGGQCKSEVVNRYSMHEHRERLEEEYNVALEAPKEGPLRPEYFCYYGEGVMEQKRKEVVALREMQNVSRQVWRLRSEVGELGRPCGVFDFGCMEVGVRVKEVVPDCLYNKVCDGSWLFDGVEFERRRDYLDELEWGDVDSVVDDAVYKCFGVSTYSVRNFKGVRGEELDGSEEFVRWEATTGVRNGEEYDMDELLRDRVEDFDFDDELVFNTRHWRQYRYGCSVTRCLYEVERLGRLTARLQYEATHCSLKWYEERRLNDMVCKLEEQRIRLKFFKFVYENYATLGKLVDRVDGLFHMGNGDTYVLDCDVDSVPMPCRWGIYFKLVKVAKRLAGEFIDELESERVPVVREFLGNERFELDKKLLWESDVVGFTTTGAAKNRGLVVGVRSEVVIVEEAAEILESHVVTSLTNDCKQLILIGDHLQLRPSTCVYELEIKYRMNVSLFERMILNGVNCCTLKTQHRMRPEIADLVVGTVYKQLLNHESVDSYPDVRGVKRNMFFVDHLVLEDGDGDAQSKSNQYEAEFLAGLCEYLLKQGYDHGQITVLTGYSGQMFLLKRLLEDHLRKGLRITTVDNYQGEENDIVLLSLVRSNVNDSVGFVGVDNRVCVALSRARVGLYVVGNMGCMVRGSKVWRGVYKKLVRERAVGGSLELVCGSHRKVSSVACREDFLGFVDGGCGGVCEGVLACGHVCKEGCHMGGNGCLGVKCEEACEKMCGGGHACRVACWMDCCCGVKVTKVLGCGHSVEVDCGRDTGVVKCGVMVKKVVCELGHEAEVGCHVDPDTVKCDVVVKRALGCGHEVEEVCDGRNGVLLSRRCTVKLDRVFPGCKHQRNVECWNKTRAKCTEKCGLTLDCGHVCKQSCHANKDPDHKLYKCENKSVCQKTCDLGHVCSFEHLCGEACVCRTEIMKKLDCGHEVSIPCGVSITRYSKFFTCKEMVDKVIPLCGHVQMVPCHVAPEDHKCMENIRCGKMCSQGHPCPSDHGCSEECMPCTAEKVERTLKCEHTAMVFCHDDGSGYKCNVQVSKRLICGHTIETDCYKDCWGIICQDSVWVTCDVCCFEGLELCRLKRKCGCCAECSKLISR